MQRGIFQRSVSILSELCERAHIFAFRSTARLVRLKVFRYFCWLLIFILFFFFLVFVFFGNYNNL